MTAFNLFNGGIVERTAALSLRLAPAHFIQKKAFVLPHLTFCLGVIFLCVFVVFFPGKGDSSHQHATGTPRTIREFAAGSLLRSLRARGNLDKQFGSLLNKVSETQETQNKGLRPTARRPRTAPACTRAREGKGSASVPTGLQPADLDCVSTKYHRATPDSPRSYCKGSTRKTNNTDAISNGTHTNLRQ